MTVTSPASNTAVSGLVTISVEAEDNEGVVRVEFHIDGELRFTDEASPWEYSWETFFYENGTRHGIVVKAYDKAGNSGSSDEVRVVVYNEINEPPTATILLPPDSASFVLGEEVILQGDGRDALGNPLREDQLTWLSRREGEVPTLLGIGTYLTTDTLTAGWHTILSLIHI